MFDRFHTCAALAVTLLSLGPIANPLSAQEFPARPVTVIVASTPGGGTDIISRIVGEQLSKQLGQPFVVENIPGAGSLTGTVVAAKAAPDGYTLQTGLNASMAVNPSLFAHLPYDPVRDFVPVGMLAEFPFAVVVNKNFPAHSIKELIALAKSRPGEINYASAGNGTGQQLSMELFKLMTGTNLTVVHYRGAAPAYTDVISGQVPVFFDNLASASGPDQRRQCARARRYGQRAIATVTGCADRRRSRSAGLPVLYVVRLWAPKNTPQPIVDKLHAEMKKRSPIRR